MICCLISRCEKFPWVLLLRLHQPPSATLTPGSSVDRIFQVKNTQEGCHILLQGIFPTQGSNAYLLHCRQLLYHWATREVHVCIYTCEHIAIAHTYVYMHVCIHLYLYLYFQVVPLLCLNPDWYILDGLLLGSFLTGISLSFLVFCFDIFTWFSYSH